MKRPAEPFKKVLLYEKKGTDCQMLFVGYGPSLLLTQNKIVLFLKVVSNTQVVERANGNMKFIFVSPG